MELQETQDYDADPGRVFAMFCDQAWREETCRAMHAIDYSVSIERSGDTVVVRTTRVLPAQVPEPAKSLVGDPLEIVQTESWTAEPDGDGTRRAEVDLRISKQPASMTGTITLQPSGSSTRRTVTGDIRVKIPLLGRRIEPEIAKAIRAALEKEQECARPYLGG